MRIIGYIWAAPVTAIGILLSVLAFATGGSVTLRKGILTACGGTTGKLLCSTKFRRGGAAMALGHVIIARNQECLDRSWNHELFHVRQFERWGIFLLPAYWLVSFTLWCRGYDPYLDNPFEPPPE